MNLIGVTDMAKAKETKKPAKKAEKKTGIKWAIKTLRATVAARVDSGTASTLDQARLEFSIAAFKQERKTKRLLAKIAKNLKRRKKR